MPFSLPDVSPRFSANTWVRPPAAGLLIILSGSLRAADRLGQVDTYRYDLVEVTRQVPANVGQWIHRRMIAAFEAGEAQAKALGHTPQEQDLYEFNARTLLEDQAPEED